LRSAGILPDNKVGMIFSDWNFVWGKLELKGLLLRACMRS